jgi:uncharacterized membrane protein (DUF106 family)
MLEKIEEQHNELMKGHIGISKQPFKSMAYISIISTPLLMWACYYINSHGPVTMVFPFWVNNCLLLMFLALFSAGFTGTSSPPLGSARLPERY